jgi:hypothetical protein
MNAFREKKMSKHAYRVLLPSVPKMKVYAPGGPCTLGEHARSSALGVPLSQRPE